MFLDVLDLKTFYGQKLGKVAAHYINRQIKLVWPNLKGLRVLGVGYCLPYMRSMRGNAERTIAFMPAAQGAVYWPSDGSSLTTLIDYDNLPLPDSSVDRIMLIHILELADNPAEHLREIWRVLTPGGRVLIVVPNRRGVWARLEHTPFAFGRPFSKGQLTHLLRDTQFTPLRWNDALYFAPFKGKSLLGPAQLWERLGRRLWPLFSGVLIVEATKLLHQGLVAKESAVKKTGFRPIFLPVPNVPLGNPMVANRERVWPHEGEGQAS